MKAGNYKSVDNYIYSYVILPLQNRSPLFDMSTPVHKDNTPVEVFVKQESLTGHYRRNYQRAQAERQANMEVCIAIEGADPITVATYHPKAHWVKMYERPFKRLGLMPLFSRLYDAFYTNRPFTKIMVEQEAPVRLQRRERGDIPMRAPRVMPDSFIDTDEERVWEPDHG